MTDKLKARMLNSEMAYAVEKRASVDELILKKKKDEKSIVQLKAKDYNEFIEQTIACHQALELAEMNVREIADDHVERERKIMEKGFKMLSEPFIPEYAGFKSRGVQEGSAVFEKGRFILSSIGGKWVLFGKGDSAIHLELSNMYQAVASLSALGLDIKIEDVLNSN